MRHFSWRSLLTNSVSAFWEDRAPRLGASLAFYTTFSIAPLLVIAVAVASLFFGKEAIQGHLKHELIDFLGKDGAEAIQAMIAAAGKEKHAGLASSSLSIVALVFGATGAFTELKDAMNTIWNVKRVPRPGIWGMVRDRVLSFAMVLTVAFLLLVSLILTAVLSAVGNWFPIPQVGAQLTDLVVSSVVTTFLFMLIFKYLPDTYVQWKEVWLGAIVTAVLFAI